jgi:hypothetical protein
MKGHDEPRKGFHFYYRNIDPIKASFTDSLFMLVVTLALMVGLPAAIGGIFYGISRLGATWGGGH